MHPTLSDFFQNTKSELARANADRRHPFRNVTLATSQNHIPSQRTVVMRKFDSDFSVTIYTDVRSQKILELKKQPLASLLFWHPKKKIQVRMSGKMEMASQTEETQTIWKTIPPASHLSYTTRLPPGAVVDSPEKVELDPSASDGRHFALLHFRPSEIDILQLNRGLHLRAGFHFKNGGWEGEWRVP